MEDQSLNNSFSSYYLNPNDILHEQNTFDYAYYCVFAPQNKDDDNSNTDLIKAFFKDIIEEKPTRESEGVVINIKPELLGKKKKKSKAGKSKGKKRKDRSHNKYTYDNMIGKVKHLVCKNVLDFINSKIFLIYKGEIGYGYYKKELMLIKKDQIANSKIEFNKEFLNKSLKEIFSVELSHRITNYPKMHNMILIKQLMNEDELKKREYFQGLFSLTFLDCLKYFRNENDEKYAYIEGLKRFDDLVNENKFNEEENDEEYIKCLRECIDNYEKILAEKKGRKARKKKEGKNDIYNY